MRGANASRVGDMHPTREIALYVQQDGDVILVIAQDGYLVGDRDTGNPDQRSASVEFCLSGGRSPHTRRALYTLIEAMKLDEKERPISP